MRIEALETRVNPNLDAYSGPVISQKEVIAKEYEINKKKNFVDTHRSLDPAKNGYITLALPAIPSGAKDTISSAKVDSKTNAITPARPNSGPPILQTPAARVNPMPVKKEISDSNIPKKTAADEGYFSRFVRWMGWSTQAPQDLSSESPLVGSPKEVALVERNAEMIAKALDQMSLALDKLIIKATEQSKENLADGEGDREAELILLKKLKGEVEIFKDILASFKDEVKSKEFEAFLATDEIFENYEEGKQLQKMHLKNAEEIEERLRTSKLLNWAQYGADGVALVALFASVALIFVDGGASLALTLIGSSAQLSKGAAMGVNAYQKNQTNIKQAENQGYAHRREYLGRHHGDRVKETEESFSKTFQLYTYLSNLMKGKVDVIRGMGRLINPA